MANAEKVLIANRGEIACRIIHTCRDFGLRTVAVHSEADRHAMHVHIADEAVEIGPSPAQESYLNREAILMAARDTAADVIHPGYGFLSEDQRFAEAVHEAGFAWVGPSPQAIADMGDKERARDIAESASVPVLPGSARFTMDNLTGLSAAAEDVGYPLLVKAAAGGGGIGMQRVDEATTLEKVVKTTQSMATKAFGTSDVYLERFIPEARHVEVQVFGFGDGEGVHLYDRDCSVQRRFQKIVEEAPAPGVPDAVRTELYRAALALVRHQCYRGAGTVEFIYDVRREEAYFLEMNTRIQVEHPVTEMLTGVDLVAWQLAQACGWFQPVMQEAIVPSGHAIECRLYAERPEKRFLPAPGTISTLRWPGQDKSLRIDAGVREGDRVTPFYDPLIAKLVSHGVDRQAAIDRLTTALDELIVEGLYTNAQFLAQVLADPEFQAGGVSTAFTDQLMASKSTTTAARG